MQAAYTQKPTPRSSRDLISVPAVRPTLPPLGFSWAQNRRNVVSLCRRPGRKSPAWLATEASLYQIWEKSHKCRDNRASGVLKSSLAGFKASLCQGLSGERFTWLHPFQANCCLKLPVCLANIRICCAFLNLNLFSIFCGPLTRRSVASARCLHKRLTV